MTEFLGRNRYERRRLTKKARAGSGNGYSPFTRWIRYPEACYAVTVTPDVEAVLRRVVVLGSGTMAPGIAASFAAIGVPVGIWGRRLERAEMAVQAASRHHAALVTAGLAPPAVTPRLGASQMLGEALDGAGLVIEAISEDLSQKQAIFAEVEQHIARETIVASTTSGLSIDDIGSRLRHRDRTLALHFWNPAHLMPLVEVAGAAEAPPELVDVATKIIRRIGKRPVVLRRSVPGFIGTRLQQAVVREAVALLGAGVADAAEIDAATRLGFGARFPVVGPLETSDLGGLDVVAAIHAYLLPDLDASSTPDPLLSELVQAGRLGAKTGAGFYDWRARDAGDLLAARDAELVERVRKLRASGELPSPAPVGG